MKAVSLRFRIGGSAVWPNRKAGGCGPTRGAQTDERADGRIFTKLSVDSTLAAMLSAYQGNAPAIFIRLDPCTR